MRQAPVFSLFVIALLAARCAVIAAPPEFVLSSEDAKMLFGSNEARLLADYGGAMYRIDLTAKTPAWTFLCNGGAGGLISPDGTRFVYGPNKISIRRFEADGPGLERDERSYCNGFWQPLPSIGTHNRGPFFQERIPIPAGHTYFFRIR